VSDFVKGLLFGSVGILVLIFQLDNLLLWSLASTAKKRGQSRDEIIESRILARRKYLERQLPHWEEV
jgi:hypothetical protein